MIPAEGVLDDESALSAENALQKGAEVRVPEPKAVEEEQEVIQSIEARKA